VALEIVIGFFVAMLLRMTRALRFIFICCITSALNFFLLLPVSGQSCPSAGGDAVALSTLSGSVRIHDGTRPWIGLALAKPTCGIKEIELAFGKREDWTRTKSLQGCHVTATGIISESMTVYYSAVLNLFDPVVVPDQSCKSKPVKSNSIDSALPEGLLSYRATVYIDVSHNLPLDGKAWTLSGAALISPSWQAYAQPSLNGEKDLDLQCHEGFALQSFSSDPPNAAAIFAPGVVRLSSSELGPSRLTIVCKKN
jgi:hypothetical protein